MMHGLIHDCLKHLILDKFGEETWQKYLKFSKCDESSDFMMFTIHKDEDTFRLIGALCEMLSVELPVALELFGEYFYHYAVKRGFAEMLSRIGRDMESFLQNLDFHHFFMSNFIYGFLNAPSFRCEKNSKNSLLLHYYSKRAGLFPIVIGFARECGRQIFNVNTEYVVLSTEEEKVKESGSDYTRYHTTFKVTLKGPFINVVQENKSSIRKAAKFVAKWQRLASAVGVRVGNDLTNADLRELLPFHIFFDDNMKIKGLGEHLSTGFPHVNVGDSMLRHMDILHPDVGLSWDSIQEFLHDTFVLLIKDAKVLSGQRAVSAVDRRVSLFSDVGNSSDGLELRGQMYPLKSGRQILFIGTPRVVSLAELGNYELFLSDIPLHDVTRDLALLNQQRIAEVELSQELERTTSELKRVSAALEIEKQKVDDLLLDILPKEVADSLKAGKQVEACSFDMVTVLFSDIVTFTVISSNCHPKQIVDMLNNLFTAFDVICHELGVYKVETIGDAYMIASGLPVPSVDHAERMGDTALGMIQAAAQVNSPYSNIPLQIRVGIHSGPVMTGVVGKKRPRYCLFGDTVNTASRMESHGVPGKIHLSESTKKLIDGNKDYVTVFRDTMEIKGKGDMKTYFLLSHGDLILPKSRATRTVEKMDQMRPLDPRATNSEPTSLVSSKSKLKRDEKSRACCIM